MRLRVQTPVPPKQKKQKTKKKNQRSKLKCKMQHCKTLKHNCRKSLGPRIDETSAKH
jgi:hypothetical protein